jgi:hypothetical protein
MCRPTSGGASTASTARRFGRRRADDTVIYPRTMPTPVTSGCNLHTADCYGQPLGVRRRSCERRALAPLNRVGAIKGNMTPLQLREWQLGCGSDQRRSMLASQPVEVVVKPPGTRRGRGWGPCGAPVTKPGSWSAPSRRQRFCKKFSRNLPLLRPRDCGPRRQPAAFRRPVSRVARVKPARACVPARAGFTRAWAARLRATTKGTRASGRTEQY